MHRQCHICMLATHAHAQEVLITPQMESVPLEIGTIQLVM